MESKKKTACNRLIPAMGTHGGSNERLHLNALIRRHCLKALYWLPSSLTVLGTPVLAVFTPGPVPAPPPKHRPPMSCCLPPWSASAGGRPTMSDDGGCNSCHVTTWMGSSQTLGVLMSTVREVFFSEESFSHKFKYQTFQYKSTCL